MSLTTDETRDIFGLEPVSPPAFNLVPPPENIWAWWFAARKGDFGVFEELAPQHGIFRYRPRQSERGEPAKIWFDYDEHVWRAEIKGVEVDDVVSVWRWSFHQPISKQLYDEVMAGGRWADEVAPDEASHDRAKMGGNSRRPEEEIRDEIESADAAFSAWLKSINGKIENEEHDAKVKGFAGRFLGFEKRIKEAHQTAKAPALEECRRIDAAWISGESSVKSYAEACKKRVLSTAEPYRLERERLRRAAEDLRREEDARRRQEQAAAARKAAEEGRTFAPAPEAPRTSFVPKKASGLTTRKVARIDDLSKVATHIAALPLDGEGRHPRADFVDVCRKIAEAMLKAGAVVPGAHLAEEITAR